MVAFGFALERVVLRPLIGRPVVAVIMATIGVAALLRGFCTLIFGAGTRVIVLPVGDEPIFLGPVMLPPVQMVGAGVSLVFLAAFTWFFLKSRVGVAMRAVADSQQVAMAMGINVQRYFALAWAMAGIVAALGGIVWGAMLGVDNQLAVVGLKVFPVVILGGLDSVIGAVVGGLIVGVVESLAAGYLDPVVGGGTKDFVPYLLMIVVLMIRPYGIFGTRWRIEPRLLQASGFERRAEREGAAELTSGDVSSRVGRLQDQLCRGHGALSAADRALDDGASRRAFRRALPMMLSEYYLSIVNLILIAVVGASVSTSSSAIPGQISIGHGALMSVGAYTAANLITRHRRTVLGRDAGRRPMAAAIGAVIGMPSLRIKGLYLAIATLAAQLIIEWTINHVPWISGGVQASIEVPRPNLLRPPAAHRRSSSTVPAVLRLPCRSPPPSTWCAAASAEPSSPSATTTSPPS